jgi:hypothetical protein
MKTGLTLIGASFLIAAGSPPDAQTREDIRCFMAMARLADTDDPKIKQVGTAGTLYFLGRLDGRTPGLDIGSEVAAGAAAVTEVEMRTLLKSCGELIEKRGAYLIAVGKALEQREATKP